MRFSAVYKTPDEFSDLIIECDGEHLTGLRFTGSKDREAPRRNDPGRKAGLNGRADDRLQNTVLDDLRQNAPAVFADAVRWLDVYFSGEDPGPIPIYRIDGLTPFRSDVIDEMLKIPFGQTVTYGQIAKKLAEKRGIPRMSAQAVGGAVGWNPICIMIPCHRVIGSDGSLTGYGGGLANKEALLRLEGSVR